jgi:hypothetical protein
MLNVVKSDVEQSCFCCPVPTRLVLITSHANFPMCLDCIMIYEELMQRAEAGEMFDVRIIDRHINN